MRRRCDEEKTEFGFVVPVGNVGVVAGVDGRDVIEKEVLGVC